MIIVNLAINRPFDEDLKNKIETSLGTENIFDDIIYYYGYSKAINYTMLFIRGKESPADEYIRILTKHYSIPGLFIKVNSTWNVLVDFYSNGDSIFKFTSTHPDSFSSEPNYRVEYSGDMAKMSIFKNDINCTDFDRLLRGEGEPLFDTKSYLKRVYNFLNLGPLWPTAYWDWENLIYKEKKLGIEKLINQLKSHQEFEDFGRVVISPTY